MKARRFVPFAAFALLAAGCSSTSSPSANMHTSTSPAGTATQAQTYTITCPYDVDSTGADAEDESSGIVPATLTVTLTAASPNVPCSVLPVPSWLSWAKQPSAEQFKLVATSDQYAQANSNEVCGGNITGGGIPEVSGASYMIDDSGDGGWSQTMAIDTCSDLTGQSVADFGGA